MGAPHVAHLRVSVIEFASSYDQLYLLHKELAEKPDTKFLEESLGQARKERHDLVVHLVRVGYRLCHLVAEKLTITATQS